MKIQPKASKTLKHWWWLSVVFALIGGLLGWGIVTYAVTPHYQAKSELVIQSKKSVTEGITGDQLNTAVAGYQDLVTSQAVLSRAQHHLKSDGIDVTTTQLGKQVQLQHQEDSNLIHLVTTASSPQRAQTINQEISDAFTEEANRLGDQLLVKPITPTSYSDKSKTTSTSLVTMIGAVTGFVFGSLLVLGLMVPNLKKEG
ncbi:YveK family protein [Levilactobacillus bambusae]|uniref:Capsular polysaccharide biosynthesis protein CpsC n=1 Tax=Levilactobacillus bambusae TaxID=2024736 RepID=A0A2V1MX67_9LACO|nr:hypothetical protein [Levilactobacillus bambusae]PWF99660.1 hypothetical protein DCM90_07540 [Levilactobacillus bambusae]